MYCFRGALLFILFVSSPAVQGQTVVSPPAQGSSSLSDRYLQEANGLYALQDWDGAIASYTKALSIDPNLTRALMGRAMAYWGKGNKEAAFADLGKVLEVDPKGPDVYNASSLRGQMCEQRGDLDGAIREFSRAIEIRPDDPGAYNARGQVKEGKGDSAGALADFDKAVALLPKAPGFLLNRGIARKALGDFDGAIADFDKVLRSSLGNARAFLHRGEARQAKGELEAAIADYGSAINSNPQYAPAFARRGIALLLEGKDAEAKEDIDLAIKLDPALKPSLAKSIDEAKKKREGKIDRTNRSHKPSKAGDKYPGGL